MFYFFLLFVNVVFLFLTWSQRVWVSWWSTRSYCVSGQCLQFRYNAYSKLCCSFWRQTITGFCFSMLIGRAPFSLFFLLPHSFSQDSGGMQSLLGAIEQSLKAGKKQPWHATLVNNICVGLLAGLKVSIFACVNLASVISNLLLWSHFNPCCGQCLQALLSFRPQPLKSEILSLLQNIFQVIIF